MVFDIEKKQIGLGSPYIVKDEIVKDPESVETEGEYNPMIPLIVLLLILLAIIMFAFLFFQFVINPQKQPADLSTEQKPDKADFKRRQSTRLRRQSKMENQDTKRDLIQEPEDPSIKDQLKNKLQEKLDPENMKKELQKQAEKQAKKQLKKLAK